MAISNEHEIGWALAVLIAFASFALSAMEGELRKGFVRALGAVGGQGAGILLMIHPIWFAFVLFVMTALLVTNRQFRSLRAEETATKNWTRG